MATELTPQQTFEQTLKDRIRNDIGNLVPDELLAQLIGRTIEDAFFKDQEIGSGYNKTREPSEFKKIVRELLQERADKQIRAWLDSHTKEIGDALAESINTNAEGLVVSALTAMFNQPLMQYRDSLNEVFQKLNIPNRIY